MHKRFYTPAAIAAAALYVVIAASPFYAVDFAAVKQHKSESMSVSGASDMLPMSRGPLLKQSCEATEFFALIASFNLNLMKAAALVLTLFVLLCDAHSKLRALKIQTARWCAS